MAIEIREADVERDVELLAATLNANRAHTTSLDRFRWLYHDNPDGRARAWLAVDDRTGGVAGFTAVFPRRVRLRTGQRVLAWNCGDFSIHTRYRTGGVAIKLRRAAREAVDAGETPFLYAHPNERMLPVHLKVGHSPLGRMVRYARPLRLNTGIALVDAVSSAALRLAGRELPAADAADCELVGNADLGEEFGDLYDRVSPSLGTLLVRDARYLDWRFRRTPVDGCELLVLRSSGRLRAYLALTASDDVVHVKDWLAEDASAFGSIWTAGLRLARKRGARSVSVIALETHPDLARLRLFGFRPRPDWSTAVTYAPEGWPSRDCVANAAAWYMTVGDRDV